MRLHAKTQRATTSNGAPGSNTVGGVLHEGGHILLVKRCGDNLVGAKS